MTAVYCGEDLRIMSNQTLEQVLENAKEMHKRVQDNWMKIQSIGSRPPDPPRSMGSGGLGWKRFGERNTRIRLEQKLWDKKNEEYMRKLATVIA
jgi:hypothetical protein